MTLCSSVVHVYTGFVDYIHLGIMKCILDIIMYIVGLTTQTYPSTSHLRLVERQMRQAMLEPRMSISRVKLAYKHAQVATVVHTSSAS